MNITKIKQIAAEEYNSFFNKCLEEAINRHNKNKVAGLNEMQGFSFPNYIGTGKEFLEYCEENQLIVPPMAIGGTIVNSGDSIWTEFIFPTTTEKQVREMARGLYY